MQVEGQIINIFLCIIKHELNKQIFFCSNEITTTNIHILDILYHSFYIETSLKKINIKKRINKRQIEAIFCFASVMEKKWGEKLS